MYNTATLREMRQHVCNTHVTVTLKPSVSLPVLQCHEGEAIVLHSLGGVCVKGELLRDIAHVWKVLFVSFTPLMIRCMHEIDGVLHVYM
jgi:hypothetical protein